MGRLAQPDLFAGDDQRIIGTVSCGVGSYSAVRRWVDLHGVDDLTLVFTDTLFEDQDAYRFLLASSANLLGVELSNVLRPAIEDFPAWEDREAYKVFVLSLRAQAQIEMPRLVWLTDGRDPWDVYEDEGIVGNSQRDPCARILKREMLDAWLGKTCRSSATQIIFGIDIEEQHRFDDGKGHGIRPRRAQDGWTAIAPLCDSPLLSWDMRVQRLLTEGLWLPRLNALGFAHNNCGGACCKGGQGHWKLMFQVFPERYAYIEAREARLGKRVGNFTMLKDRRGGLKPLPLSALRKRDLTPYEASEMGGCGCFTGDAA